MQLELRLADSFVSAKHVLQQPKLMIDRRQRVWSWLHARPPGGACLLTQLGRDYSLGKNMQWVHID